MTRGQQRQLFYAISDGVTHDPERSDEVRRLGYLVGEGYDAWPEKMPVMDAEKRQLIFDSEIVSVNHEALGTMINEPGELKCNIDSSGGDGFAALNIARALTKRHKAGHAVTVTIKKALSAAAIISQGGSHRRMYADGRLMVHPVVSIIMGNAEQLRRRADDLDALREDALGLFVWRTGQGRETVLKWFSRETNFTATEALAAGLIDEII